MWLSDRVEVSAEAKEWESTELVGVFVVRSLGNGNQEEVLEQEGVVCPISCV